MKGQDQRLTELCDAVLGLGTVQRVEARVLTGSLIIHHDGSADELVENLESAQLLEVLREPEHFDPVTEAQAWSQRANGLLQDVVGKDVNLGGLASLALFAIAVRQLAAGNNLPPAATALWYGLNLLSRNGRNEGPPGNKSGAGASERRN